MLSDLSLALYLDQNGHQPFYSAVQHYGFSRGYPH